MRPTIRQTRQLITADIASRCAYENKTPSRWTSFKLLLNPGVSMVALYRWQCYFDGCGLGFLGGICRWLGLVLFTSQIDSLARIAGGLVVIHGDAILIGADVEIGPGCILFSQNAIGRSPFFDPASAERQAAPRIGSNVIFGVGACAHGPIHIGDGCRVAVNSLVEIDADAGSTLYGVPARVVAKAT